MRASVSRAKAPEGRYRVISAAEAERRFAIYRELLYSLVEMGLVHDVGGPARDPRKSERAHTKYPEWELAKVAQDLAGGLTVIDLAQRAAADSKLSYVHRLAA